MNIRYSKTLRIPRLLLKYLLTFSYPLVVKIWKLPNVKSIDETLAFLIQTKCSMSRFGDGEFLYIIDKLNLPFQRQDPELRQRLIYILSSNKEGILIGLPSGYYSINDLTPKGKLLWKSQISWIYPRLKKFININNSYYNSSFTRFYIEISDKSKSIRYLNSIKQLWDKRSIVIIEGEKSRLGVGNDLFDNVNSISRILCPKHHAFSLYDIIIKEASMLDKSNLILIALGPTATVLAYDLAILGYQAIDIGNIDIEYEWFLSGAKEKTRIPGKYTSEAKGGRIVEDIDDDIYRDQIIAKIL